MAALRPMFAAHVIGRNRLALGADDQRQAARWPYASAAVFVATQWVPGFGPIGFAYLIGWYFAVNRPQIRFVKEALSDAFERRPRARVALARFVAAMAAGFAPRLPQSLLFGVK